MNKRQDKYVEESLGGARGTGWQSKAERGGGGSLPCGGVGYNQSRLH